MRKTTMKVICVCIIALVLSGSNVFANEQNDKDSYTGRVRVFMVEPLSRWTDVVGFNFNYGFLDFALDEYVDIEEKTTQSWSSTWDTDLAGYGDIQEDNIMAIAVVYNSDWYSTDAYPPNEYWFNAHYVDAAVGATPSFFISPEPSPDFTHTVFTEAALTTA